MRNKSESGVSKIALGLNKTGIDMSPLDSEKLISFTQEVTPDIQDMGEALYKVREEYVLNADPVGSVTLPGKVKGAANVLLNKLSGKNVEVFLDKLGERIAFERTGVRLYDALIDKFKALDMSDDVMETLLNFREEEAEHLAIVVEAMRSLGGDPTSETPCADVASVTSSGVLKVIADPRMDASQSLQALLTAESTDKAGWEILVMLAEKMEQQELVASFTHALQQELDHEETIKNLLKSFLYCMA